MGLRQDHREWYWTNHDKQGYECPDCQNGIDEVSKFQVVLTATE